MPREQEKLIETLYSDIQNEILSVLSKNFSPGLLIRELGKRIKKELYSISDHKTNTPSFNPIFIHRRFQKMREQQTSVTEEIQGQQKQFLYIDLWTFAEEYVLHKWQGEYFYEVQNDVKSGGYDRENLLELCKNLVDELDKKFASTDRATIEKFVYGKFLIEWMKVMPIGAELMIASPPGSIEEGYAGKHSYSMIFHYQKTENADGKSMVKMHWFRRWMNLKEHRDLLKEFGTMLDTGIPLTAKAIIAHPTPLPSNSLQKLEEYLKTFVSNASKDQQPVETDESEFKKEFDFIFYSFYFPLLEKLTLQDLSQQLIDQMELLLNFTVRRWKKWIEKPQFSTTNEIEQMKAMYEKHVAVQIEKTMKFENSTEAKVYLGLLEGLLGP